MPAGEGRLIGEGEAEIETEDGVLVVKRIHVTYRLELDPDADRAKVERALATHAPKCPMYRTVHRCVDITTSLEVVPTSSD